MRGAANQINGSTSDGKLASLPFMTRSLILGQVESDTV
jgi:hypothetical protein